MSWRRVTATGRRDKSEPAIVKAFREGGASVEFLGTPVDLLVGFLGETHLVEAKTDNGGLTEAQMKFRERWTGKPPVEARTPAQAKKWLRVWAERRGGARIQFPPTDAIQDQADGVREEKSR